MEFVSQNLLWIAIALISGGALILPMLRGAGRNGVSASQAVMLINREDALILDVRSQKEFEAGHLPNARHIPLGELDKRTEELSKYRKRPVVVVCQSGSRSAAATSLLHKAGFEQAVNLDEGIVGWEKAGQHLVRGA